MAKKKLFGVYIKSLCEAPDYEREIWAESKPKVIKLLQTKYGFGEWNSKMLSDKIFELNTKAYLYGQENKNQRPKRRTSKRKGGDLN